MARFAHIALGSVYELDTLLLIAAELDLANAGDVAALRNRLSSLSRQVSSYIQDRKPTT